MAQKFEQTVKTVSVEKTVNKVTAGWLLLVGRGVEALCPYSAEPRSLWPNTCGYGPSAKNNTIQFFDWMAWHAASLGWKEAIRIATAELLQQPLGRLGPGSSLFWEKLKEWLEKEWDNPPTQLSVFLADPAWQVARKRSAAAWWMDENLFQAMNRLAVVDKNLPSYQEGEAIVSFHKGHEPLLKIKEGIKEARVYLGGGMLYSPGCVLNGALRWAGADEEVEEEKDDSDRPSTLVEHDRMVALVRGATQFWQM